MANLTNHRFLKALRREQVDRTPIWIMRQAGRYLPEYRKIREQAGAFLNLVKNPELAAEVTLQPLARFPLDAAILFSDILTIPDALNCDLKFTQGEGPVIGKPIRLETDIDNLPEIEVATELDYVSKAIINIKNALVNKTPLIGFAGSPWTVATYLVEGGSSKAFAIIKKMAYSRPDLLNKLLQKLSALTTDYLKMQIKAGVDAIMLFDTWGGVLSQVLYEQFSCSFMQEIISNLRQEFPHIPIIVFTKGGGQWLENIADITKANALGLDWTTDIGQAFTRVGNKVALQGNLDPSVLYSDKNNIKLEVKKIMQAVNGRVGHIFNLGHGIHQDINPDNVAILVEEVQRHV